MLSLPQSLFFMSVVWCVYVCAFVLPALRPVFLCVAFSVSPVQEMRISQILWEVTSMLTEPRASVGVIAGAGWPVEVK